MPLYHFNLTDHIREPDDTGTDLADDETARVEAIVFAGAYLKDNPGLLNDEQDFKVEVTDENKVHIFSVIVSSMRPKRL